MILPAICSCISSSSEQLGRRLRGSNGLLRVNDLVRFGDWLTDWVTGWLTGIRFDHYGVSFCLRGMLNKILYVCCCIDALLYILRNSGHRTIGYSRIFNSLSVTTAHWLTDWPTDFDWLTVSGHQLASHFCHMTRTQTRWAASVIRPDRTFRAFWPAIRGDWMTDWLTGWLIHWLTDWLTDWQTDSLTD